MTRNVGDIDRVLRIALGVLLIAFAWFYPQVPYSSLGWIGVIPLLTAVLGTCPAYSLFGVSTCKLR